MDIGTQGVRVTVVDGRGTPLAAGSAPLDSLRGEGRGHEQNPEDWWRAAVAACRQATAGLAPGGSERSRCAAPPARSCSPTPRPGPSRPPSCTTTTGAAPTWSG
ncbi:hypothetical protein ACFQX6_39370 [Streptosporangium lutulentum]